MIDFTVGAYETMVWSELRGTQDVAGVSSSVGLHATSVIDEIEITETKIAMRRLAVCAEEEVLLISSMLSRAKSGSTSRLETSRVSDKVGMTRRLSRLTSFALALAAANVVGCGADSIAPGPRSESSISASCEAEQMTRRPSDDAEISANASFTMVSEADWDDAAVRRVLHTFAFGGHATDAQIKAWADLSPGKAIVEMLTFDSVNLKLSPRDSGDAVIHNATLGCMNQLWTAFNRFNRIPGGRRESYDLDEWVGASKTFLNLTSYRGTNPFRQRIGFFETNYHLVANMDVEVSGPQIVRHYDVIMENLASGASYDKVLSEAALTAAIAKQYGHDQNRFVDGVFSGNEDFAREFHQLFFGILGVSATNTAAYRDTHEYQNIPMTARALTDIRIDGPLVTYGNDFHYPAAVTILGASITGNTAREKILSLGARAIDDTESLQNLPLMIVEGLADDNLTDARRAQVRAIWQAIAPKDLLKFLRVYAISTLFHSVDRVKFWTSFERNLISTNLTVTSNHEVVNDYYDPNWMLSLEGLMVFRPSHNVFGSQKSLEAAANPDVYRQNFRRSVDRYWLLGRTNDATGFERDWGSLIPADSNGQFYVKAVAEWLWQRYVADGLKNFGTLERLHVYALLGSGRDLGHFLDKENPLATYTNAQLQAFLTDAETGNATTNGGKSIQDLLATRVLLRSADDEVRRAANYRVGLAVNFITATPFAFAQEGK